jgi:hypothetical protein
MDDILLSGRRVDEEADGLKIKFFPPDGHFEIVLQPRDGGKACVFELCAIEDLVELKRVIQKALSRHKEITEPKNDYLSNVRRILSPQTENVTATILNA